MKATILVLLAAASMPALATYNENTNGGATAAASANQEQTAIGVGVGVGIGTATAVNSNEVKNTNSNLGVNTNNNLNSNEIKNNNSNVGINGQQQGLVNDNDLSNRNTNGQQQGQSLDNRNVNGQGQDQRQSAASDQDQSQEATANNNGNAQTTNITSSYKAVRNAPSIGLASVYPTADCSGGFSLGGSGINGSGGIGFSLTKKECRSIVLAQNFAAIGMPDVSCDILMTTKAFKRAVKATPALQAVSCAPKPIPPVTQSLDPKIDMSQYVRRDELKARDEKMFKSLKDK